MAVSGRQVFSFFNQDSKDLYLLITPSWLSGVLAATGALCLIVATVFATQFPGSSVRELLQTQTKQQPTISNNYQAVDSSLSLNTFVGNLPLLIFWAAIGLLVYSAAINLINIFRGAVNLKETLEYVHVDRHKLLAGVLLKLAVRLAVLILWLVFIDATVKLFLPYSIAAVQYASDAGPPDNLLYGALAFAILTICLHLHVVFLRLLRLRPRLLGSIS